MPVTTELKGPEALEHATAATLRTYFNAELDAIYAAWALTDAADGLSIPKQYPAKIQSGQVAQALDYPFVMVASDHGSVVQGENAAPNWATIAHLLVVAVWLTSDDEEILKKQMHRYLTAVWEVLTKHPQLDGSIQMDGGLDLMDYGRGLPVQLNEAPGLLAIGGWTFQVVTIQGTSNG